MLPSSLHAEEPLAFNTLLYEATAAENGCISASSVSIAGKKMLGEAYDLFTRSLTSPACLCSPCARYPTIVALAVSLQGAISPPASAQRSM
jgi:hypothetical protein